MGLKDRLNALRQQTGQTAAPSPTDAEAVALPEAEAGLTLRDRLARRGLHSAAPASAAPEQSRDELAADVLGGHCLAPGLVCVEHAVPLASRHGRQVLLALEELAGLAFHDGAVDLSALVFMDTETTGLAGGTGTIPFLIGLARLDGAEIHLRQLFLTGYQGEAAMLAAAADWIRPARMMVSFNGKSFDAPLLATRYRMMRQPDPFARLAHIDLVHPTRNAYRALWEDCRLQTAEKILLDFHRIDDLPGAQVPDVWFRFVRFGQAGRIADILTHNRLDLVSLAALLPCLHQAYTPADNPAVDAFGIARHYLRQGREAIAFDCLQFNRARLEEEGRMELARLYRRQKRWPEAVAIWLELAESGHADAMECLAKYHEHEAGDLHTALIWTQRLMATDGVNAGHTHRAGRLKRKSGEG